MREASSSRAVDRSSTGTFHAIAQVIIKELPHQFDLKLMVTDPDDIILGPPKTAFASASSSFRHKDSTDRPALGRNEDSRDRFGLRKNGEVEHGLRESRGGAWPRRGAEELADKDAEGWSTVKPRKSFGAEGVERFNGRMGGDRGGHRNREDRRFQTREEVEGSERIQRTFDDYSRKKDGEHDPDGGRNGIGRGRSEPSWFKGNSDVPTTPGDRKSNGDRFAEKTRNWRDKDERYQDRDRDRGEDRSGDKRWDRDSERNNRYHGHQERDPEWMDEPSDGRNAHTAQDFQKWKERMKAGSSSAAVEEVTRIEDVDLSGQSSFFGLDNPKVDTHAATDNVSVGPDKFFETWSQKPKPETSSAAATVVDKAGPTKAATAGKASRFTSFFAGPKEEKPRSVTEPPPRASAPPSGVDHQEQAHFALLMQKLQVQTPPANQTAGPQLPPHEAPTNPHLQGQDQLLQSTRPERSEPASRSSNRDSQHRLQDLLTSRTPISGQTVPSAPPVSRPEQVIHDLVNQRQNLLSQGSTRQDSRPVNSNTEFLMNLMQNAGPAPQSTRNEQHMRGPPPQSQAERQVRRPELPPGFFEDDLFRRGPQQQHQTDVSRSQGSQQPTQILQRPPPGLEQGAHGGWNQQNGQLPPMLGQGRHIAPPPGLQGGRGIPPPGMFPPGFPPVNGFPPDGGNGPSRNMGPPPPGFMMPPPPGFPSGPGGFPMPPPDSMNFGGLPFDGRGLPPGNFRRQ